MRLLRFIILSAIASLTAPLAAQTPDIAEPFKVGTFGIADKPTVGIVLRDRWIVELEAANAALQSSTLYPALPMPADMLELIERYEYGLKKRIYEIVNDLVANDRIGGRTKPAWIHEVADVRTLPPIMYPGKILNAAVNFYTHVNETGTPEEIAAVPESYTGQFLKKILN